MEREKKKCGCYEGKGEISYAHETLPGTLCEQLNWECILIRARVI